MAFLRSLRRLSAKPKPLGLGTYADYVPSAPSFLRSIKDNIVGFRPGSFFEEKYFWGKAHLGVFFLLALFTPTIYRSCKDFYWTRQLRKLSAEEIISDRYEWLRLNMIKDEVEASLLKRAPTGPVMLGPSLPE